MAQRIYTKTGDRGQTGLWGGTRVYKDHVRIEALGNVDEINAALGMARSLGAPAPIDKVLERLQNLLFELGTQLATPANISDQKSIINMADIVALEQIIDDAEEQLTPLRVFVLPAGAPVAAALHLARATCRRAERHLVTLCRLEPTTPDSIIAFINRLGDLLFVLARLANHLAHHPDVPWRSRLHNEAP